MPQIGERKTKNGITGEWNGTTWIQVEADAPPVEKPAVEPDTKPAAAAVSPEGSPGFLSKITDWIPAVGGTIGGLVGGMPGAALGGAAGEGVKQTVRHATELPGIIADVGRNLVEQPAATLKGFVQGAGEGAGRAAIEGGKQAAFEGAGNLAAKGVSKLASNILRPEMARIADPAIARTFKEAGSVPPAGAAESYRQTLLNMAKQFGLTGGAKDSSIIAQAPQGLQEELTLISNQLGKVRPFSHIWSTLAAMSELPAAMSGHGVEGLGISLPLVGIGMAGKHPGPVAQFLERAAPVAGGIAKTGLRGLGVMTGDPIVDALLKRQ